MSTTVRLPFQIDAHGRSATATDDALLPVLIEQVLFTQPGERVNRPDFGTGLMQLVFEPNSSELATATQFLVQSALQQWLGALIHVEDVAIDHAGDTLRVTVQYVIRRSQERRVAHYTREGSA